LLVQIQINVLPANTASGVSISMVLASIGRKLSGLVFHPPLAGQGALLLHLVFPHRCETLIARMDAHRFARKPAAPFFSSLLR
jgi:hypothetical protein